MRRCVLTPTPNGNNSLSPSKRGEGWGEGFVLVNIGLLTPALSSLREAREKKWCVCHDATIKPLTLVSRLSTRFHAFNTSINASCGMFTVPNAFMRFLPSFCFSSNLRLRVMSPP